MVAHHGVDTSEATDGPAPGAGGLRGTVVRYGLAAFLLVGAAVALARLVDQPPGARHLVSIPAGTAARVAAGDDVALLPPDLQLRLGDTLIIRNGDSVDHTVGPYTIAAGERLETTLSEVASFDGFCSLHPGSRISIEVSAG